MQLLALRPARVAAHLHAEGGLQAHHEGSTTEYQFNKHNINHLFCATCGIQSYARCKEQGGAKMVSINVRCLNSINVNSLKVKKVDIKKL